MTKQLAEKVVLPTACSSAAEAAVDFAAFIAALKRCATQNQVLYRIIQQPVEAARFQNKIETRFFRKL